MRLYHFAILFAAIAIVFITIRDISYARMSNVLDHQYELDAAMEKASDAAANELILNTDGCVAEHGEQAKHVFFQSLYASLGIVDDTEAQQRLSFYVPFIAIADEDGLYLNCYEEVEEGGKKELKRNWSQRIPYRYETEQLIYEFTLSRHAKITRKSDQGVSYDLLSDSGLLSRCAETIADVLETRMSQSVNANNQLAQQYGITYQFYLPSMDHSMVSRAVTKPSILFLFQGYPLADGVRHYEHFSLHAASVEQKDVYLVTKKDWYYLYHRTGCSMIEENADNVEAVLSSPYECAAFGAYPCQECFRQDGWYDFLD